MIKEYTSEIQPKLEEFFEVVLNAAGWGFHPEGRHSPLRNINNTYPKDKGGFWLYYLDNMIIGTVAVRSIDDINKIAELKCMYVLPEYQCRGYGKKLLKYALEQAENIGYRYIRLDTRLESVKAINLYKATGFYEIERYNDNEMAELFMEMEI